MTNLQSRAHGQADPQQSWEHGSYVRANGINIFYMKAGTGQPLILLNNGMISSSPIWADWPSSYVAYRATLAEHFLVIEPDFRGSGRSGHDGGPITYDLLADDVMAIIEELQLRRPFLYGYGDGGEVATIVGIRNPASVAAIVSHGGYDLLNPDPAATSLVMTRQMLGGRPDASEADPDYVAAHEFLGHMVELMRADHDAAQGDGHWRTVLSRTFERVSQPAGYTIDDLHGVSVPMLIAVGDRDPFCPLAEGVAAYQALPVGELAVLPDTASGISPAGIAVADDFFRRHLPH
jgi:pimeloyl-ACP methyl ester carboxylesterase